MLTSLSLSEAVACYVDGFPENIEKVISGNFIVSTILFFEVFLLVFRGLFYLPVHCSLRSTVETL